jgi:hypothetical protein
MYSKHLVEQLYKHGVDLVFVFAASQQRLIYSDRSKLRLSFVQYFLTVLEASKVELLLDLKLLLLLLVFLLELEEKVILFESSYSLLESGF